MYFATSFNSVAIAEYVVTTFEKECLQTITFHMAKIRTCFNYIELSIYMQCAWIFVYGERSMCADLLHYWVHPYIKTLKNQNHCLVSFIRHVSGDYPPASVKSVCTITHCYTSKLAVKSALWFVTKCVGM